MNKRLVQNSLKDWLQDNGFEEKVKLIDGSESFFDFPKNTILLGVDEPSHTDLYSNFCTELGLIKDVGWPTLTFLHELGHGETDVDDGIIMLLWEKFVRKFSSTPSHFVKTSILKARLYYTLPMEKEATEWAIDYINNNDTEELEDILECLEK